MIDGPLLLREAIDAGVSLEEVFAEPEADPDALAAAEAAGARVHFVPAGSLAGVSGTVTPQGVAAIARAPLSSVDEALAAVAAGPCALVLVGVADPGNAGTLLRAAEATGAAAVLFCAGSVDPTNPKCVRASAGSLFHVTVANGGEAVRTLGDVGERGVRRVAAVASGGTACDVADLRGPVALVLGNEAHGLPEEIDAAIDLRVSIPMVGRAESLNVAMAGSILCYESLRQRRGVTGGP